MHTFPGVVHAFTRPEKTLEADAAAGLQFNDQAALRAWDAIRDTLATMSKECQKSPNIVL
jgi:dienelactone hydrolase